MEVLQTSALPLGYVAMILFTLLQTYPIMVAAADQTSALPLGDGAALKAGVILAWDWFAAALRLASSHPSAVTTGSLRTFSMIDGSP